MLYSHMGEKEDKGVAEYDRRGTFSLPPPIVKCHKLLQTLPGNYWQDVPMFFFSQVQPPSAGYEIVYALGPFQKKEDADKARKAWVQANRSCYVKGVFDLKLMTSAGRKIADGFNVAITDCQPKSNDSSGGDSEEVVVKRSPDNIKKSGDFKEDGNRKDTPASWVRRRPLFANNVILKANNYNNSSTKLPPRSTGPLSVSKVSLFYHGDRTSSLFYFFIHALYYLLDFKGG
jgi:hypothetical protein